MATTEGRRRPTRQRRGAAADAPGVSINVNAPAEQETPAATDESESRHDAQVAAEAEIDAAAQSLPKQPVAKIYRIDRLTGQKAHVDTVTPSLVTEEWLGREFGGGKYYIEYRKPGGSTGQLMVYDRKADLVVDETIPPKPPRWAREAVAGPVMNADGSVAAAQHQTTDIMNTGIMAVFQAMQQSQAMQMETFRALANSLQRPADNGNKMLEILAPIIGPALVALLQKAMTPQDPLETAKAMKELFGAKPAGESSSIIAQLKEFLELKELLGESAPERPDPLTAMVTTLGPKVLDMAATEQRNRAQAIAGARAQAGQVPPMPAPRISAPAQNGGAPVSEPSSPAGAPEGQPVSEQPAEQSADGLTVLFAGYVPRLLDLARKGRDPYVYAIATVDNFPDGLRGYLREYCLKDDLPDIILTRFPELREFEEWARDFIGAVQDEVAPLPDDEGGDDDDDDETATEPTTTEG